MCHLALPRPSLTSPYRKHASPLLPSPLRYDRVVLTASLVLSFSRRFIQVKDITPALTHQLPQVCSLQASKMPPTGAEYSRTSAPPYPLTASPKFHRTVSATDQPLPRRNYTQKTSDKESHPKCTSPALEILTLRDLNPENPTPEKPGKS